MDPASNIALFWEREKREIFEVVISSIVNWNLIALKMFFMLVMFDRGDIWQIDWLVKLLLKIR